MPFIFPSGSCLLWYFLPVQPFIFIQNSPKLIIHLSFTFFSHSFHLPFTLHVFSLSCPLLAQDYSPKWSSHLLLSFVYLFLVLFLLPYFYHCHVTPLPFHMNNLFLSPRSVFKSREHVICLCIIYACLCIWRGKSPHSHHCISTGNNTIMPLFADSVSPPLGDVKIGTRKGTRSKEEPIVSFTGTYCCDGWSVVCYVSVYK